MIIFGNRSSQNEIIDTFGNHKVNVLSGPSHVGKMSFLQDLVKNQIMGNDLYVADNSVDTAREAIKFASTRPTFTPYKVLIVDDAHKLSESAQDAYLKLFEEPPEYLYIYIVTEDYNCLLPALRSRISYVSRWTRLDSLTMDQFIQSDSLSPDKQACLLSNGCPGLYHTISSSSDLKSFDTEVQKIFQPGFDRILAITPAALSGIKEDLHRDAIINMCHAIISELIKKVDPDKLVGLSKFASVIKRFPSVNAEIYWTNYVLMYNKNCAGTNNN